VHYDPSDPQQSRTRDALDQDIANLWVAASIPVGVLFLVYWGRRIVDLAAPTAPNAVPLELASPHGIGRTSGDQAAAGGSGKAGRPQANPPPGQP
jgi:hypothetical protein